MKRAYVSVLFIAVMSLLALVSCVTNPFAGPAGSTQQQGGMMGGGGMMGSGMMGGGDYPALTAFSSNGERIYYTGLSTSGRSIPFYNGPMWLRMRGGACVNCHGVDGRGGIPVMMGTAIPPDISYHTLTEAQNGHNDDGHSHQSYNDELIKRAIIQGRNPEGQSLDFTMPRWQMTERDVNDIILYLKTFTRQ